MFLSRRINDDTIAVKDTDDNVVDYIYLKYYDKIKNELKVYEIQDEEIILQKMTNDIDVVILDSNTTEDDMFHYSNNALHSKFKTYNFLRELDYIEVTFESDFNLEMISATLDDADVQNMALRVVGNLETNYLGSVFAYRVLSALDLSLLNTNDVHDFNQLFYGAVILDLNFKKFDTSHATEMSSMFENGKFDILDLTSFNTKNVISMERMFCGCTANLLDLTSFNLDMLAFASDIFVDSQIDKIVLKKSQKFLLDMVTRSTNSEIEFRED